MESDERLMAIPRRTIDLLFRNLQLFAGVATVPVVGEVILVLLLYGVVQSVIARMDLGNQPVVMLQVWSNMSAAQKALSTVIVLSSQAMLLWAQAAAMVAMFAVDSGRATSVTAAYRGIRPKASYIFLVIWILAFLPVIGWLLALACIPAVPSAVLENRGIVGAFREAASSRGYAKRLVVWLFIAVPVIILVGVTILFLAALGGLFPSKAVLLPVSAVFCWIGVFLAQLPMMSATLSYARSRVPATG